MGNGQNSPTGPGAIELAGLSIPERTLTISNLFADGKIQISFDGLTRETRKSLAACFN